ncbi:MAG: hypothetical protein AAGA77_10885 [Bacteroidota bacterium]
MTNGELKAYIERFKKNLKEVHSTKESSIKFLKEVGILDENGDLSKNYQESPS